MSHPSNSRPHSGVMRPPPVVPVGLPVSSGAARVAKAGAFMSPSNNKTQQQHGYSNLMPPPPLPTAPSMSSSTSSSRPSLSGSDMSLDGRPGGMREERVKTPLQDSTSKDNIGGDDVDARFEDLLNRLEVPSTVRIKFGSVNRDVKRSILESSTNANSAVLTSLGLPSPAASGATAAPPSQIENQRKLKSRLSTPLLRKQKSSISLDGDDNTGINNNNGRKCRVGDDEFVIVASPRTNNPGGHMRGQSMDVSRPRSTAAATPNRSRPNSVYTPAPGSGRNSVPQSPRSGPQQAGPTETPENLVRWLSAYKGTDLHMDVNRAKKLRMLLRHESTGWVSAFLAAGGYVCILDRLQDLLDVEWREEQHDDKMLYELLRCVKAMTTSDVGKAAVRAAHPRPFVDLSELLFSEKKPGDLACRQIIVELWLFHFELYPAQKAVPASPRLEQTIRFEQPPQQQFDVAMFVRSLLLPENKENKAKDYHEFVTVAHRPRIFKAWVQELSDICRDYFWIMCHANNTLWDLEEVNEKVVERPVAPGGATGGVEFEAMGYVTLHFRLLNALSQLLADGNPAEAQKLHHDLLASGLDRILVTLRKASTTYYPTLHLELARYVYTLRANSPGKKLPYLIGKLVGPPPEELRRRRSASEWLPRTQWSA